MAACLRIGTSGYAYPHWRGPFYPPRLPQRRWLPFYAEHFCTVELNAPFYGLPGPERFAAWRDAVPPGFVFAVKASRFITHVKRLKDPQAGVERFLANARELRQALGPVLFQLPGTFPLDPARLEGFLAALARQRILPGLRAVLEVRHPSWLAAGAVGRLRQGRVALCLADWPDLEVEGPLTADFVYVRRHGTLARYGGSYPEAMLRRDARRIRDWLRQGRDVYVYFNNDWAGHAVRDALRLGALVQGPDAGRR